jgi:AcrR family transcriptional regulator
MPKQGIRAVGVDAIAEAAGTNKMTLYRHFESKDELVAEYLRHLAAESDAVWQEIAQKHPNDPRAQLNAWIEAMGGHIADIDERGCALANAAIELPEKNHPARPVIEAFKQNQRERLAQLCRAAGLGQPELVADELFLLLEGARVSTQSVGHKGPGCSFIRMGQALVSGRPA